MTAFGGSIPQEVKDFLDEQAEQEGKSFSEMVEFCVRYTAEQKYSKEI